MRFFFDSRHFVNIPHDLHDTTKVPWTSKVHSVFVDDDLTRLVDIRNDRSRAIKALREVMKDYKKADVKGGLIGGGLLGGLGLLLTRPFSKDKKKKQ